MSSKIRVFNLHISNCNFNLHCKLQWLKINKISTSIFLWENIRRPRSRADLDSIISYNHLLYHLLYRIFIYRDKETRCTRDEKLFCWQLPQNALSYLWDNIRRLIRLTIASANFPRTHPAKPSTINYHRLLNKMHTTHMLNNEDYRLIIGLLYMRHFNDQQNIETKFMRNKYFSRKIEWKDFIPCIIHIKLLIR